MAEQSSRVPNKEIEMAIIEKATLTVVSVAAQILVAATVLL
jgi:hypothetical protein